uniref:non-specific serine/threonine protein kinase n=3 Tax=Oryza brachyantha TaxID=4533 RepID=J3N1Y7_ORYBR
MRQNQIHGSLPSTMEFMAVIDMDLSSNQLSGPLPKLPTTLSSLDISKNNLSGPLPLDLGASELAVLILFDNSISGAIPSSLCKIQSLQLLDISGNKLTGSIPDCIVNSSAKNSTQLRISNLSLRNNKLSGKFPSFLQKCKNLFFLDLAHNQFSGTLPAWIGEDLPFLVFLRLRSNLFSGHIPVELTKLVALQYFDVADNNLSGGIPKSMESFHRMRIKQDNEQNFSMAITFGTGLEENELNNYIENVTVVTKGQERLYTGEIIYMVNIDLSCNHLTGEIPEMVSTLVALTNLNFSWNSLSGEIPEKIGSLSQLESLDLSHNMLSGMIPNSITSLTYLSHMNLSYNNLSGRIPKGNQLDVLEDPASMYIGNIGLCGDPLPNCSVNADPGIRRDDLDKVSFLLGMIIGFVVGLLPVFYLMLFSSRWRNTYFATVDGLYDRVYVQVAVACRRL